MSDALVLLLWLRLKGFARKIARGMRSIRRALLGAVTLAFFALYLFPLLLFFARGDFGGLPIEFYSAWIPLILFVIFAVQLVLISAQSPLVFSPEEMNFLFPGPFSRREILLYKICTAMPMLMFSSLFLSLVFLRSGVLWAPAFVGIFLFFLFAYLTSLVVNLVQQTLAKRFRWWFNTALLVLVALVLGFVVNVYFIPESDFDAIEVAEKFRASLLYTVLLAPFRVFSGLMTTAAFTLGFYATLLLAIGLNAATLLLVFRLDTNFIEVSAAQSRKVHDRMQRFKRGDLFDKVRTNATNMSVPMLPRMGGIGPIAYRQLTAAIRGRQIWLAIAVSAGVGLLLGFAFRTSAGDEPELAQWVPMAVALYFMIFLTASLRYDFRSEIDCFERIKTLPLPSIAVALGELFTPVLIATLVQVVLFGGVALTSMTPPMHPAIFLFILPFNTLIFAVENAFFLTFPTRNVRVSALDASQFGRNMLVSLAKMVVLLGVVGVSGGVGFLVYYLFDSPILGAAIAGLGLTGWCALFVMLVAYAYGRLDPSRDIV